MSQMWGRNLPKILGCVAVMAAISILAPCAFAQQGDAPTGSRGENFSAKPAAQLFQSDCTGSGCHKGPQGLAAKHGFGLAGFLREHYTNSRESAAALASYLSNLPSGREARERKEARKPRDVRPEPAPSASVIGRWFESGPSEPPSAKPKDGKPSRRTAARPERLEEPGTRENSRHDIIEPGPEAPKPNARERGQRNRTTPPPAATASAPPSSAPAEAGSPAAAVPPVAAPPAPAAAPEAAPAPSSVAAAPPAPAAPTAAAAPVPESTPAPAPSPAPKAPPPAPKRYDIFD